MAIARFWVSHCPFPEANLELHFLHHIIVKKGSVNVEKKCVLDKYTFEDKYRQLYK